ncbi:GntR family transcriptional regulator [Nocardia sp. CA-135953]|uniref:GntR family transcriptional regulator n=1 Tax=Nocardia sp. CA-135953 TaxID=3239978 RepID=UPI003D9981D5
MAWQLEPIGRTSASLADVAYERISNAMMTGLFAPGARLVMDQLADQLAISRTPVRDALLRLEREGLIEPTGRRGYVVSAITVEDVEWIYEAREAVEGFSARRVAEMGPAAIDIVAEAIESVGSAGGGDVRDAFSANLRIHRALVEATGNPVILVLFDDIWQRARGMATFADYAGHVKPTMSVRDEHLPLLDALRSGPDEAFTALRGHIREGRTSHLD